VKKWTALHEAARFGHADTAAYLISQGLSRNAKTSDGMTPKALANHLNHSAVMPML
jgi:ankyrin repeat protein